VWDSLSSWFRLGPDNRTVNPTRRVPRTTLFWLRPLKAQPILLFDKLKFVGRLNSSTDVQSGNATGQILKLDFVKTYIAH